MRTVTTVIYTASELRASHPDAFERARAHYAACWDDPWRGDRDKSYKAILIAVQRGTEADVLLDPDYYPTGYSDDRDFAEEAARCLMNNESNGTIRACLGDLWGTIQERERDYACSDEGFADHADANGWEFDEHGNRH